MTNPSPVLNSASTRTKAPSLRWRNRGYLSAFFALIGWMLKRRRLHSIDQNNDTRIRRREKYPSKSLHDLAIVSPYNTGTGIVTNFKEIININSLSSSSVKESPHTESCFVINFSYSPLLQTLFKRPAEVISIFCIGSGNISAAISKARSASRNRIAPHHRKNILPLHTYSIGPASD